MNLFPAFMGSASSAHSSTIIRIGDALEMSCESDDVLFEVERSELLVAQTYVDLVFEVDHECSRDL